MPGSCGCGNNDPEATAASEEANRELRAEVAELREMLEASSGSSSSDDDAEDGMCECNDCVRENATKRGSCTCLVFTF